ncbi:MAG TPA: NAD-dependent epimerase/dehydratase family protein [Stellaceae bacterium]|nr:NAD-dependent epimerase/dehydratase family protein [Stellaceae bacterium]
MERILITGATGFIGRALVSALAPRYRLVLALRTVPDGPLPASADLRHIDDIGPDTDWAEALREVDTVIHLAGRAHVAHCNAAEFDRVNHRGSLRLAEAARAAGVGRLLYLSSAKVHGEESRGRPFDEADAPRPEGAYAASKWAAEQGLARLAAEGGPATVILRPPLVYGPGAKANFAALLRLCRSGLPLPFGALANRRSLLFLGNLAAAIEAVLGAPPQPDCRTFLLRDGEDLSTPELVRRIRRALGGRARLLPVPALLLSATLRLAGRGAMANPLLGSFAVDDSRFRREFAWTPPFTVDEGLAITAAAQPPGLVSLPAGAR